MANSQTTCPSGWKLFLNRDDIKTGLSNLSKRICKDYPEENIVLVGVLTGAVYFTVDLSRMLRIQHSVGFIRASSYGNNQMSTNKIQMSGLLGDESESIRSKHVIVLDELYDSGRTLNDIVSYLRKYNPLSIKTCVMFRKHKEDVKFAPPDYCAIDNLPDVWYVGYGLDDCGAKREYEELYAVPKSHGISQTYDDIILVSEDALSAAKRKILTIT
jgi:hypoxanthine phosphoribosyltransferase